MDNAKKLVLVTAVVAGLVIFAAVRSWSYLAPKPKSDQDRERQTITRVIENTVPPDFNQEILNEGIDELQVSLRRAAENALRSLPQEQRPNDAAIVDIARLFAEYMRICRAGDFDDYEAWAESQGLVASIPTNITTDQRDAYWQETTRWARAKPMDPDSVTARALFVRGRALHDPFTSLFSTSGPTRTLRRTGTTVFQQHDRSALEIRVTAIAPSVDGKTEQAVGIGLVFANDGPNGEWHSIGVLSHDVPQSFVLFLPPA